MYAQANRLVWARGTGNTVRDFSFEARLRRVGVSINDVAARSDVTNGRYGRARVESCTGNLHVIAYKANAVSFKITFKRVYTNASDSFQTSKYSVRLLLTSQKNAWFLTMMFWSNRAYGEITFITVCQQLSGRDMRHDGASWQVKKRKLYYRLESFITHVQKKKGRGSDATSALVWTGNLRHNTKKKIVLIHCRNLCSEIWRNKIPTIRRESCRRICINPDLR